MAGWLAILIYSTDDTYFEQNFGSFSETALWQLLDGEMAACKVSRQTKTLSSWDVSVEAMTHSLE